MLILHNVGVMLPMPQLHLQPLMFAAAQPRGTPLPVHPLTPVRTSPFFPLPFWLIWSLKVTAEVTKQLAPLLSSHGNTDPGPLTEVSLGNTPALVTSSEPTASMIQGSINTAHSILSDEPLFPVSNPPALPTQLFNSVSVPIDARVSTKLRTKIWNNEFINFGSLLINPVLDNKYQINLQHSDGTQPPSLCLEPAVKPKKIHNIEF